MLRQLKRPAMPVFSFWCIYCIIVKKELRK